MKRKQPPFQKRCNPVAKAIRTRQFRVRVVANQKRKSPGKRVRPWEYEE